MTTDGANNRRGRSDVASGSGTERSRKREREILDAAAEIFRRQGYADTSVQDVADAVGILKGSLYYYIDSKEDLLFRVLSEVHEMAGEIVEAVRAMDAPPLERLDEYIRRHVEYNTRNLAKIAVYYHDFGLLSQDRRAEIVKQRAVYEDLLGELIREAQATGEVDPNLSPRLVSNGIFGMLNWIYTWFRPEGSVTPDYLGRLYANLVINGITGTKMEGPPPKGRRTAARKAPAVKRAPPAKKAAAAKKTPAARKS